jgi:hypothetical protein
MKRAINQHRQNYPMATVRMSSIEVLHEMFIVSSDPLLALVTKSAQRVTPHRQAEPARRHPAPDISWPDALIASRLVCGAAGAT